MNIRQSGDYLHKADQHDFGSDEVAYIMYSVPASEHGPFDLDAMQRIAELTEALEYEVPFVDEVTSLTNVEFMIAPTLLTASRQGVGVQPTISDA